MSLINEALRRAEVEKRGQLPHGASLVTMTPVSPADEFGEEWNATASLPTSQNAYARNRPAPKPRRFHRTVAIGLVMAAGGAFAAWVMLNAEEPPTPTVARTASALTPTERRPARTVRRRLGQFAHVDPSAVATKAERTLSSAVAAIKGYVPSPREPLVAAKAEPTAAPPDPPATSRVLPPSGDRAALRLRLGGVLRSDDGATAIVNDRFLKVGDTIEGAKVVKITQYGVTLERDGKTVHIGQ